MNKEINELLDQIKKLESELLDTIQNQQQNQDYHIEKKRILFNRGVKNQHRNYLQNLIDYLSNASPGNILTAPVIWAVVIPAVLLDITVSTYQLICFPVYGIPKVKRSDYIVFDRHYLSYLNFIEKINCAYCSYFNGMIAYVQEIAARTEQYWCPIKHARRISSIHSRYQNFLDYGDAKAYRSQKEKIRRQFDDLSAK